MNGPYQTPVANHGLNSPPPSARPTMSVMNPPAANNGWNSPPPSARPMPSMSQPMPEMPPYSPYAEMSSPAPNPYQQLAVYHQGQQVNSPPQMNTAPATYPTPSSQSTVTLDAQQWQEFMAYQRQKDMQRFEQPPVNMMPRNPQYVNQNAPPDSGYGTAHLETLGQSHGLPGQQQQSATLRPGHKYGNLTASGNARVIRGNVSDSRAPNTLERFHVYGDGNLTENARIFEGNVTSEEMKGFWN